MQLDNKSIKELFPPHKKDHGNTIPFEYCHTPKIIQLFQQMGNNQQKLTVEKGISSYVYKNKLSDITPPRRCFGLRMQDLCQMTNSEEHKKL